MYIWCTSHRYPMGSHNGQKECRFQRVKVEGGMGSGGPPSHTCSRSSAIFRNVRGGDSIQYTSVVLRDLRIIYDSKRWYWSSYGFANRHRSTILFFPLNGLMIHFNENAWALTRPPATCPLCQYPCPNVIKWGQDVTWRHDITPWHRMTSNVITKRLWASGCTQVIQS